MEKEKADDKYIGKELQLFECAANWKSYFKTFISKFLTGHVLEVGTGIGGTTKYLCDGKQEEWICLEPDKALSLIIDKRIEKKELQDCCINKTGRLKDIPKEKKFDAILYIDVIEHLENDYEEIENASNYLNQNGVIIILVPAHNFLYSRYDKAIGHYRRYSRKSALKLIPGNFKAIKNIYIDSAGLFVLLINKFILKQSMPTLKQVLLWDKFLITFSKFFDRLFFFNVGKSLLLIIKKNN